MGPRSTRISGKGGTWAKHNSFLHHGWKSWLSSSNKDSPEITRCPKMCGDHYMCKKEKSVPKLKNRKRKRKESEETPMTIKNLWAKGIFERNTR